MSNPIAVVGQSIRVNAALGVDLTGASAVVIEYRPPSPGVAGEIAATVDSATLGSIHATIPAATLVIAGEWAIWASATFPDGGVIKTYAAGLDVVSEGTIVVGAVCG